jgi:hypothetical protein
MARRFSFKLSLLFNEPIDDAAGNWQYAAADAVEQATGETAQLIATKRTNTFGGFAFPVSMLTATILFAARPGEVAPNITIQGVHDLTTNDETGSVSSASPGFADQVGGTFSFDAATGVLTLLPPAERYSVAIAEAAVLLPDRVQL